MLNKMGRTFYTHMGLGLLLFISQITFVNAAELAISNLEIATQAGDKLQIELEMSGPASEPKVFHTDNPARIVMDFAGVKNALDKKMYPINQGAASSIYVAEAEDRVRVVVNLLESTPFETKVQGNKVLLTLTRAKAMVPEFSQPVSAAPARASSAVIASLIPEQTISGFDFKRGENGEGRILITLASPNTIVNSREEGGNVVISLLNTRLPDNLAKKLDVSDFATPVKSIETDSTSSETTIRVSPQNTLYDYSLFQSEGLLTVEFRPLTPEEKEVIDSKRDKYNGERLSLNFQDIDIRSVIAVLAEFTGQNVVAGDEVAGTITVKLDDVPWDEALDFIMMTKGLEKYETGNVTLIAPIDKIKEYKEKQRETEKVVERLEPLVTEYIKINYARAENFRNLLNGFDTGSFGSCGISRTSGGGQSGQGGMGQGGMGQGGMGQAMGQGMGQGMGPNIAGTDAGTIEERRILSLRGSAVVDARTNTLIVRDTPKKLEEAKKLIHRLDVPVRQVMIESRIVIASNNFARELGVRFGVAKRANVGSGRIFGVGGEGTRGNMGTQETSFTTTEEGTTFNSTGTPAGIDMNDMLVDLAASNPYGALGMTLARGADYVLNLELSALQDEGKGEILSNPRVMTTDRCQATIKQGTQIPFQTSSGNLGTNIEFKEATLTLDVTPQITPSGSIIMDLEINKDAPGQRDNVTGNREIDTREVKTNVRVNDGETIVLGGIYESNVGNVVNKVPFFADLPGIGFLFKKTVNSDDKSELLVFVTPKIVKDALAKN